MTIEQMKAAISAALGPEQLREQASALEAEILVSDREMHAHRAEFSVPRQEAEAINQATAKALLFRARADRLEGNEAAASAFERQAARVLEAGSIY